MESAIDSGFVFEKISRRENGQLLVNDDGQIGCFGLMNGKKKNQLFCLIFHCELNASSY